MYLPLEALCTFTGLWVPVSQMLLSVYAVVDIAILPLWWVWEVELLVVSWLVKRSLVGAISLAIEVVRAPG
jgi:hypothetical protein